MPNTDFTAILNEVDDLMKAMVESKVKARWEVAPWRLQIVAMRIENEKLSEMRKQTGVLEKIAEHLSNISGSAQSMEPRTTKF